MATPPTVAADHELTGRFRYRRTWLGQLVLQVEESYVLSFCLRAIPGPRRTRWRDASFGDCVRIHALTARSQWEL